MKGVALAMSIFELVDGTQNFRKIPQNYNIINRGKNKMNTLQWIKFWDCILNPKD